MIFRMNQRSAAQAGTPGRFQRIRDSLPLAFAVALGIRLLVLAFQYQGALNPARDHWAFGYEGGRIARAMVLGRGYSDPLFAETGPTAIAAPLYMLLMAGVFKVFGIYTTVSGLVILSLDCLFSALTCLPIYFIGCESFGAAVGGWAAWAWALFPFSIFHSTQLISDVCLATLLLTCIFLTTLRFERPAPLAAWAGFGLLWGITALDNPSVLSLLPFLCGWVCYRLHRQGRAWRMPVTVAGLALVLVISPWVARNYHVFHRFIPFRDNFWQNIYIGNNADSLHFNWAASHTATTPEEMEEFYRLGELGFMAKKREQAIEFIRSHPRFVACLTLRRIVQTWTRFWSLPAGGRLDETFDPDEPFDPAAIIFCTGLTVLSLTGLWRAFALHSTVAWPYALALLVFPLIYYLTNTFERYRHPIDPEIVILAVYAITGRAGGPVREEHVKRVC